MTNQTGFYSLIQFCPDASRLEGVNIGVVLYESKAQAIEVLIAQDNKRIKRFFGDQDWEFVHRAKSSIASQLRGFKFQTAKELEDYIRRRANVIQLTPLRSMRITNLQSDTQALFHRLVGPEFVEPKRRIDGYLTRRLIEAGVASLVRRSVTVTISELDRAIRVPYGYQNGRFNLITPVQFGREADDLLSKTGKSALEGRLLYDRPDPQLGNMRLVVIAKFEEQSDNSEREFVRKTFDNNFVTLHTFENFDPLIDDIKRSANLHVAAQPKELFSND